MPTFTFSGTSFRIQDNAGTLRDISPSIVRVGGLPGTRELVEVTSLSDAGRQWIAGLENAVIILDLLWTIDANTGSETVMGPIRTGATGREWDYGPRGTGAGNVKYSGTALMRSYEIMAQVGTTVSARAELQTLGTITRGTY